MTIEEEFNSIHPDDLWIYNKLQLSKKLNYSCGPVGMEVPSSGLYIVRPCVNFQGMGRNAKKIHLEKTTDHLDPGDFWCEIFKGRHLSVDYHYKKPVLSVRGYRNVKKSFHKWACWMKTNEVIEFPSIFENLTLDYEWINCEFIGGKLIEVHIRTNPDFRYQNKIAIPVWKDDEFLTYSNMTYVNDEDNDRLGFWIK